MPAEVCRALRSRMSIPGSVKDFIADVVKPKRQEPNILVTDQQFIKMVHDELCRQMGNQCSPSSWINPTIVLMGWVTGNWKTTAAAKLALVIIYTESQLLNGVQQTSITSSY